MTFVLAALAALALLCAVGAGPAAADGPSAIGATEIAADAAKKGKGKKKTRAQKLAACLKRAKKKPTRAKRTKARRACKKKYGAKLLVPPVPPTPPTPPAPPADQLRRDDAAFAAYLTGMRFYRVYEVNTNTTSATHEEYYNFCNSTTLYHHFEALTSIYRAKGPWRVLEGNISPDTTKGQGSIEFVQQEANFQEEVGKTQSPITISWNGGDTATIAHPEITPPHEFSRNPGLGVNCP